MPRLFARLAGLVIAAAALAWLWAGLRVTTPMVLVDEYAYLIGGRSLDHLDRLLAATPTVPQFGNSLFLRLINVLSTTTVPIDVAIKVINVAAITIAAKLLATLAIRSSAHYQAFFCICLIAFYPTGSYAAYVLPESLYALVFAGLVALLLSDRARPLVTWHIAGLLLGLLTLFKAHGLFALAAFLAATVLWGLWVARLGARRTAALCGATLAGFALVAIGGGAIVGSAANASSHTLIGDFYFEMIKVALRSPDRLAAMVDYGLLHLAAILTLFAPSVAFLVRGCFARPASGSEISRRFAFVALFLLSLMVTIVGVIVMFVGQEPERIHLRYINFAFPSLLLLSVVWSSKCPELETKGLRFVAVGAWCVAAGFLLVRLPGLRLLPVDSPELFFAYSSAEFGAFGLGKAAPWLLAGLVVILSGGILARRVRVLDAQIIALLVLLAIAGLNSVIWQGRWSGAQVPMRHAGDVARLLCPGEGQVVAVSTPQAFPALYTAMAAVDRIVPLALVREGQVAAKVAAIPSGSCLLTNIHLPPRTHASTYSSGGVYLYRAR